jgi:hypothetical protein
MNSKDGFDKVAVICVAGYLSAGSYEWALGWLDAMKMTGSMSTECNERLTREVTAKYVESLKVVNHG